MNLPTSCGSGPQQFHPNPSGPYNVRHKYRVMAFDNLKRIGMAIDSRGVDFRITRSSFTESETTELFVDDLISASAVMQNQLREEMQAYLEKG